MAFSLKLPKFERNDKKPAKKSDGDMTVSSVMPSPLEVQATSLAQSHRRARSVGAGVGKMPLPKFLKDKPIEEQIKYLAWAVGILVAAAVMLVVWDNFRTRTNTAYLTGSGEMRMLSQRLAKASSLAVQGNSVAFSQIADSQRKFAALLTRLVSGGEVAGVNVGKSPAAVAQQLETVKNIWRETDNSAQAMSGQEATLIGLGQNAATVMAKAPQMLELTEQLAEVKLTGGSVREVANANKMVTLSQRMTKNVMALQIGEKVDPEIQVSLSKDAKQFKDLLDTFVKSATDAESKDKLSKLEGVFGEYNNAINNLLTNIPQLVQAKGHNAKIMSDNEALLAASDELAGAYQNLLSARRGYAVSLVLIALLAVSLFVVILKLYMDDSRRRADDAEKQRLLSETTNRDNQDAILRLMNELGDLADGDLTVTATVSENITGAIADSINYTIEELRVLVGRINDAATRVTAATEIAKRTSAELIEAARKQSQEIQVAGESALAMASSMTKVSGDANESAQVARQSLSAAEKGAVAMQDSIKGMNEIRGQI
ncbi:MAG: methyl-accepting chemotaxis protein, partial [Proteobacteria bacterium]|nr:methyl-accepting chemotaxis protein [Pseudomonadota bacterium]